MAEFRTLYDALIIGGGISGLVTAHQLGHASGSPRVLLVESQPQLGGNIKGIQFANGHKVDTGPDSVVANGDVLQLVQELGLKDQMVVPTNSRTGIWSRGRIKSIPQGLISGVPVSIPDMIRSNLLSPRALARASFDFVMPKTETGPDISVATLVGRRFGGEIVDRLVGPLMGGVYAGDPSYLSAKAVAPALFEAAQKRSLFDGLRQTTKTGGRGAQMTLPTGITSMVDKIVEALPSNVEIRCNTKALAIVHAYEGWLVETSDGIFAARNLIIAAPAYTAANLLQGIDRSNAPALGAVEYASVATLTFRFKGEITLAIPGFLIPVKAGFLITAVTVLSARWAHHQVLGESIVRCSVGRHRDNRALQLDDDELIRSVNHELNTFLGITSQPIEAALERHLGSIPQYGVGHVDSISHVRRHLPAGIWLTGSAYAGVGIASCIADSQKVVRELLPTLPVPVPA